MKHIKIAVVLRTWKMLFAQVVYAPTAAHSQGVLAGRVSQGITRKIWWA